MMTVFIFSFTTMKIHSKSDFPLELYSLLNLAYFSQASQ